MVALMFARVTSGLSTPGVRVRSAWYGPLDEEPCGATIRCYSSRRGASGFINRAYSCVEIDALAAYCMDLDRCFLIPIARIDGRPTVRLRVAPARNNQIRGVNLAEDFDFAVTLKTLS